MRIAVVGPTRAGKTVYLASLLRAAFARQATRPIKVRPNPSNAAAVALDRIAGDVVCGATLPATADVTTLELFVDLPGSFLFGIGRETLQLQMVDVPGGDCFPAPGASVAPAVARSVSEAQALLVVVPADRTARPGDMGDRLLHLVRSAQPMARPAHRRYPFLRVAVVVSMAELLVPEPTAATTPPGARPVSALSAVEALAADIEVARLCGAGFIATVRRLVPPGGDWYSLVSAFGFDPATGAMAAEHADGGWRVKTNGKKFRDDWWPYRAFEPLEFLGRGVCWREAI